jgi:hypothetical protein
MPHIAYNEEYLLYNPSVLVESEKKKFIIREVSAATFEILQNLPSKAFELGTNVHKLVE